MVVSAVRVRGLTKCVGGRRRAGEHGLVVIVVHLSVRGHLWMNSRRLLLLFLLEAVMVQQSALMVT